MKMISSMILLFLSFTAYTADLHVDVNNTSGNENGSHAQPFNTIQEAVDAASDNGDVINVAQGVYIENIRIENKSIQVLGSYGESFTARSQDATLTTIQSDGSNAAMSLVNAGETVIDGFRITGGTGNTDNLPWSYTGGGIYSFAGSPIISNNIIEGNNILHDDVSADDSFGGGIGAEDSNIRIENNTIRNNTGGRGAGISVRGGNSIITNNIIQNNIGVSDHGGGLYIASPSAEISSNLIENNEIGRDLGYGWGGGIIVFNPENFARMSFNVIRSNYAPSLGAGVFIDEGAQSVLDHELIYNNQCEPGSSIGGTAVYLDSGEFDGVIRGASATLTHCTIANNPCEEFSEGNGLLIESQSNAFVSNCIFWGNGGDDFFVDDTSSLTVSYTNSEETIDGLGNISSDPLFADSRNHDYHLKSTGGRWLPPVEGNNGEWVTDNVHSPCIDAGDPNANITHEPQPNGGRVNMGVYGNTQESSLTASQQEPTPDITNTPTLSPTPTEQATVTPIPAIPTSDTSGLTLIRNFSLDQANEFTELPGGFGNAPAGVVSVGALPSDSQGMSDGTGVSITTAPGQISLLQFPSLTVDDHVVLLRASVHSTVPGAAVALAALDSSFDGSVAANIPANSNIFMDRFHRIIMVYDTPSTAITPIFQVANLAGDGDVTIYLDNVEIYSINKVGSVPNQIFYGSNINPIPHTPSQTPTPVQTPTPLPEPGGQNQNITGIGGGGALYSASLSPFNTQEMYMATDMTGVFHTLDFGRNWETLDFRELQGGVNSHVRFTSNPQILYALHFAEDFRIPSKSEDGGQTWSPLPDDPTESEAYFLYADPNSTERLMITTWDTLFFSNDGGESFQFKYSSNHNGGLLIGGVFWDGDLIIIATLDGLLVSTNGGDQFSLQPINGIPDDEVIIAMAGAKENGIIRLFAVTHDPNVWVDMQGSEHWGSKSVYRLDWGESSWSLSNNGFRDCDRPFFVSMALNDIDTAFVAGGNIAPCAGVPIVYKTFDGGTSWDEVFLTENNQNIATGWMGDGGDLNWSWAETALGFAVSPIDPNRAILTDFGFAHVTGDGGATWRQAYVEEEYENPPGSPISQGQPYRTNGVQNTSCWWLHWTGDSTVLTAFTDIQGIRSEDNGESWSAGRSLGLPHNSTYQFIEHSQTNTLYGCTSSVHDLYQSTYLQDSDIDNGDGSIVFSTGQGQSWELFHNFGHPVIWMALDEQNNRLYASVVHRSEGGIYVTNNLSSGSNSTWQKLAEPPRTEGHPFSTHVLKNGDIVASYSGRRDENGAFTESSGVFISRNQGQSWEDVSHPDMFRWTKDLVIDPHDPNQNTWYACVFSHWGTSFNEVGGIYQTTGRGGSWERISDLYRVESVTLHPTNPNIMYVATEVQGLWVTTNLRDPNPTFTQVDDYPFRHPTRMFFEPNDITRLWVLSFGGGIKILKNAE